MRLAVVGRLSECFLLTYAVDADRAAPLLPKGLRLVTRRSSAFLNVVVCRIDRMRPRFVPHALGVTYWQIAYRLQVRATLARGGWLDGLYFLRSDVDLRLFGALGNWLTDFRFHRACVQFLEDGGAWELRVEHSRDGLGGARLRLRAKESDELAPESPFTSWQERELALKYTPLGLSVSNSGRSVRLAEVIRDEAAWKEVPVEVIAAEWAFPRSLGLGDLCLERATQVAPIDYRWSLGRTEDLASE